MQIKYISKTKGIAESQVQLGGIQMALTGSISGSFAGFIVTPFDVIKTKLMTQNATTTEVVTTIMKEEGIKGMYRGAGIRMIYLGVGGSAFFGIYEQLKSKFSSLIG